MAHFSHGIRAIFSHPGIYSIFQLIMGGDANQGPYFFCIPFYHTSKEYADT
jgi:hypothetical protein